MPPTAPASKTNFRGGRIIQIGGSRLLGSSRNDHHDWIDAREADRRDPPIELRLRDGNGIETDYVCVRLSATRPYLDAGYEQLTP
jgi:hypothetical protein